MSSAISPASTNDPGRAGGGMSRSGLSLPFDPIMAIAVLGICACSLVTLYSVRVPGVPDGFYFQRQAGYFVVGAILAVLISRVDYSRLREVKWGLYGFMILTLLAVMALGSVARGSRRAIQLPFLSFQASELGKIVIVIVLAAFVVDRARRLGDRDTVARTMLVALFPAALVMLQPDLGSALVYVAIVLTVLFVAGVPGKHFAALITLGVVAVALVLFAAPKAGVEVLQPYQVERLTAFLDPSGDPDDAGYQQNQSRIAIGSGEKLGRRDAATQTRDNFLPENQTDFIFATLAERYGFVGGAILLSFYALLMWRTLRALTLAKNLFGAICAGGILAMLLFQVFVNVGMNVGIMPITGIPLPLMSYGGSSVITTFVAVGLLLSIHAQGRAATASKGRVLGYS
ncbi:MAG: rod shape-determining protein RodA [Solirubrobacterales bacterium]|nr:rod shape-determining protein RodA [Solirubrobacterales bacterium]